MIIELGVFGILAYAFHKAMYKSEFEELAENLQNLLWLSDDDILDIKKEEYGLSAKIKIQLGWSYENIKKSIPAIQDSLGCICEMEKEKLSDEIAIKLIINPLNDIEYQPVPTSDSSEVFLGYKSSGEEFSISLDKDPNILLAGISGTGKDFLLASIITNIIYFFKNEISIYLFQIKKAEVAIFEKCPGVAACVLNEKDIKDYMKRICSVINERALMFSREGIKNLKHWNKKHPENQLKRIFVVVGEISYFTDDEKSEMFKYFTDIVKTGRMAGVTLIGATQRTTASNLGNNGNFKSQMAIITGRQRTEGDSINAIETRDAVDLGFKEFIYSGNKGNVEFKTPTIDEDFEILAKYVPEIRTPNNFNQSKITNNSANLSIVQCENNKYIEHEVWKKQRGIKTTIIDLAKEKKAKQKERLKEEQYKNSVAKPNSNKNSKKGKISLSEVATDVNDK